jgi:WD40 repeat protein
VTWLNEIAVSPDGKLLAAQGGTMPVDATNWSDRRWYVWVWDVTTGQLRQRLDDAAPVPSSTGPSHPYSGLTFSGLGELLVSSGAARPAVAWKVETWREETDVALSQMSASRLVICTNDMVVAGAIADNGSMIRVTSRDPFNTRPAGFGPRNEFHRIPGDEGSATSEAVDFTPTAERVAAGGTARDGAGLVVVRETQTTNVVGRVRNLPRPVARVALTADGKTVAAALSGENPAVYVCDVATGKELKRLTGLRGRAAWLGFAPDGKRLFAASTDTTVLAFDTGDVR